MSAAGAVAEAIGATFVDFNVEDLVGQYMSIGEKVIGRKLDWTTDDLAMHADFAGGFELRL